MWSLLCAGIILTVCVLIPRGFCGYLCPLGTLIDLFDWTIGKQITRFRVPADSSTEQTLNFFSISWPDLMGRRTKRCFSL